MIVVKNIGKHRYEVELGEEQEKKNYNVLYLSNKYINAALLSVAKSLPIKIRP